MARGRKKEPQPVEEESDLPPDTLFDSSGNTYSCTSKRPQGEPSTEIDSVDLLLGQDYTQDIVDEVKKYPKPVFDGTDDSLDPVEDFSEYVNYGFKLPPKYHDLAMRAAEEEIEELEKLKGPIDPELAKKVEQRRQLVAGRPLEDVRWLKHKAYYRAMRRLHAAREADAQEQREQYLAAKGAPLDAIPADIIDLSPQQYVQRATQVVKDEAAQAAMGPSSSGSSTQQQQEEQDHEQWDMRWTAPGYDKHPQVIAQLAAAVSQMGWWGTPAHRRQQLHHYQQQQQEEEGDFDAASELSEVREEPAVYVIHRPAPYQAYTPEYLAKIHRREEARRYQQRKRQAFWLSLGTVLAGAAVRWYKRRGKGKKRGQQQQQKGQQQQQRQGSVGSTPRRTPSMVSG